jgi:hypothetical protein
MGASLGSSEAPGEVHYEGAWTARFEDVLRFSFSADKHVRR